jgi:hypothetical protein
MPVWYREHCGRLEGSRRKPDVLGYRKKFGVIVPFTNTVVEADYIRMAPTGHLHTGRVYIGRPGWIPTPPSRPSSSRSGRRASGVMDQQHGCGSLLREH